MEFVRIEQTDTVAESPSDSSLLFIPKGRIIKVLKNAADWGEEGCLVKIFHEDFSGTDSAIVVVEGQKTGDLGRQLGLADAEPAGRAATPRPTTATA